MAHLEGSEEAIAFSSGMGAIASTFWTLLNATDHLLSSKTIYGGTHSVIEKGISRFQIEVDFADFTKLDEIKKNLKPNTKVVFFETPANPTLEILDIKAISDIVHQYNPQIQVIVDNTFSTPIITKPLIFGADIVIHSATKYINGHSDVMAGIVCGKSTLINKIRFEGLKDLTGAVLSPHDAFLVLRGLSTLELRLWRACKNARIIAARLKEHPKIKKVFYPGLTNSATEQVLYEQQMKLPGAIISFELKCGYDGGIKLLNNLKLIILAVSLGGVESLIEHPASMTHSNYNAQELADANISEGLVRLSIGIEYVEDLWNDLEQALKKL